MSYTAIPPQDRALQSSCNGYVKRSTLRTDRSSSLKSPVSVTRRSSGPIAPTSLRKTAPPDHQEIYEGFTFPDEQRRKHPDLCPVLCWPQILDSYLSPDTLCQLLKCGPESINPFAFKNLSLERIYVKYFSVVYRSIQLGRFFLLAGLFCLALGLVELVPSLVAGPIPMGRERCWLCLSLAAGTTLPLVHIHWQRCMRPHHMAFLKLAGFALCCGILIAVSPIWGRFNAESESFITVGLWETIWLIITISCFYPVTFYTLLALTIFLCMSHSIISILLILLIKNPVFSSKHWAALSGNWLLFIPSILLGCVISYLQQKMLRKAFLYAREFLNNCVDNKVANEKLDRLLSCIVPIPILTELKQSILTKDLRGHLPSVVHLRNVSFLNVEICGLSRGTRGDGNGISYANDTVKLMNELFSRFDMLGQELGCYQVRVQPDDYLSLAGYPETRVDHAKSCTELAFRIHQTIKRLCDSAEVMLDVRTVVHTGVTYGAVMGHSRMIFDLLGDDVRILRYMLGIAATGKVMVSKPTYDQLPDGYKGDPGPRLEIPMLSMSMSASGDCNRMDTLYLRPKNIKQNSILANTDLLVSDNSESQHEESLNKTHRGFPVLTNLFDGIETCKYSQKVNLHQQSQTHKSLDYSDSNEKGCEGHNSRAGQSDSLSSSTNQIITKATALSKLAQTAKFNANIPYYFLTDDSFLISSHDDDRLLLDIGGAIVSSNLPNNTSSPVFHGTTKSSVSWKSTLKSQFTQSLIGSYQIDEDDISIKKTTEINLSISKVTNTFIDSSVEIKFQKNSENYLGLGLLVSLSSVLFITGVHGLMLAKTVILLLIFLVAFMWIGLSLLMIILIKMKCISNHIIRSRLSSMMLLTITSLAMFALIITNSFCCKNTVSTNFTVAKPLSKVIMAPPSNTDAHLNCPLPVYIPFTTVWIILPLIVMLAIPETIKIVIVLSTIICTCLIILWTHEPVFTSFSMVYRSEGVPVMYIYVFVAQMFFSVLVLWKARILNGFRRLVFKWQMKTSIKREEYQKLTNAVDRAIDILLPKFVVSHYHNPSRNYMNLFSCEYKTIAVLSVSIPAWCPAGMTEPSDVANNIRVLNQILITFDDVMESSDYDGITKIRTAGDTAWYAVGVDPNHPIENVADRCRLMTNLLRGAEMLKRIVEEHNSKSPENRFLLRIGIHMGSGFSGVIGGNNPVFGVWGEAYFGATLVQRCGQLDHIHVTSNFMVEVDPSSKFSFYDVGTLIVNQMGQLISLPPGQWPPGTISMHVYVLRENNPCHGSMMPGNLGPTCTDESLISSAARRNSMSVVMTSGESMNHYVMNSPAMMPSNNPNVIPRSGGISNLQNVQNFNNTNSNNCNKPPANNIFTILPITSMPPNLPVCASTNCSPQAPVVLPSMIPSGNGTPVQIVPHKNMLPPYSVTVMKSPPELADRKSLVETRSKVHHYRNLPTELPDSLIPPSPPPHRRIYQENMNMSHGSPPLLLSQSHQFNSSPLESQKFREKVLKKEVNQMTQSAISPPKERNGKSAKCITPSSSMDSFLELEKACSTNPRTKSTNYSVPPNERLSLIPESYKSVPETDFIEDESYHNIEEDIASIDIMTTSDDRIFEIDETDIMSHHNPMYTDNEYESMAESQANLLDPMEEIRRSRLIGLKQKEYELGAPLTENKLECINSRGNTNSSNSFSSNMLPGNSFDFPDYRRPASPNGGINGDDSDHLSKRNRNSSNSRDSSSIAARRSGGATSSDESGKKESNNNESKHVDTSLCSFSNGNQQSLTEETFNTSLVPRPILCSINDRDVNTKGYDNGSSCISLVTDLGWTSYDDDDMYSDYPGYAARYRNRDNVHQRSHNKPDWGSKWSDSNDLLSSNVHPDEDDSDVDCIRFHSDLISDLSENPLVSDLETETDCDVISSNPASGSVVSEDRINSFYKFPGNNILHPDFYINTAYKNDKEIEEQYSQGHANGRIFTSHPYKDATNLNKAKDEIDIYFLPNSTHKDDQSATSNKTPSRFGHDQSKISRLPDIAPVRMPDFGDLQIGREVIRPALVSRFAKKHGRYTKSSPERSDYDNVSERNSLQDSRNHIPNAIHKRNSDIGRYNYADDSDALSGYVGDVASSVYDSDEEEDRPDRRFTQLYLDYNVDNEDPMAPYFPRLPPQDFVKTNDKSASLNSQSNSESGKRSDYDNIDSDRLSDIHSRNIENKLKNYKNLKSNEDYQQQITEEARKINLVFQNPWIADNKHSKFCGPSELLEGGISDHAGSKHRAKSYVLNSHREMSVESEISPGLYHSFGFGASNEVLNDKEKGGKARSTECLLTFSTTDQSNCHEDGGSNCIGEHVEDKAKGLSKILQRAERVRSLLPTELHSYILPGCFSSSSLNSSGKSSDAERSPRRGHLSNDQSGRQYLSDEEHCKQ